MIRDRRLWAAVTVFLLGGGALYYCSAPPDDGDGGRDGSTDQVAEPAEDTAVDAPATDATEPDASADAATEDVAVDASPDVADAIADADAAPVDAGVWVVLSCYLEAPTIGNVQVIASDGKGYRYNSFMQAPGAGTLLGNWGNGAITFTLSQNDQTALFAATKTLQTSDAGTTTTTGPAQHGTTRNGSLKSAGAYKDPPMLVHSLIDGMVYPPKQRVEVVHNDPAATIARKWGCFETE